MLFVANYIISGEEGENLKKYYPVSFFLSLMTAYVFGALLGGENILEYITENLWLEGYPLGVGLLWAIGAGVAYLFILFRSDQASDAA